LEIHVVGKSMSEELDAQTLDPQQPSRLGEALIASPVCIGFHFWKMIDAKASDWYSKIEYSLVLLHCCLGHLSSFLFTSLRTGDIERRPAETKIARQWEQDRMEH
jgi:hypothetical protein